MLLMDIREQFFRFPLTQYIKLLLKKCHAIMYTCQLMVSSRNVIINKQRSCKNMKPLTPVLIALHVFVFFIRKFLKENEPQKPENLKKMLRKSPPSNA